MNKIKPLITAGILASSAIATPKYEESYHFVSLSNDKVISSKNEDKPLIPASVTKLIIGAATLSKYGPSHQFKTPIYYTGEFKNGTITGDIFIKGSGDPFLTSEILWQAMADLKTLGLRKVNGSIIIDQSFFKQSSRDESRRFGKNVSKNAYDAPLSALAFNFNTFALTISQSSGVVSASFNPHPISEVKINNEVKVSSKKSKITATRSYKNGTSTITLTGNINSKDQIEKKWVSIPDPNLNPAYIFNSFLKASDITVIKPSRIGSTPKNAKELYTIVGFPIEKIVKGLEKFSNNFIADMLAIGLSHDSSIQPSKRGTLTGGVEYLNDYIEKFSKTSKHRIKNASGLSTENRLSCALITKLLKHEYGKLTTYPEFLASLPASGVDGTLESRFKSFDSLNDGQVRAKTGTLTAPVSVSGLGGYFNSKKHGMVAFCHIQNGISKTRQPSIYDLRLNQEKLIHKIR